MQIILIGNNPPYHSAFNQYAFNFMIKTLDNLLDHLVHTLFRIAFQPTSKRAGIIETIFGIDGPHKLLELLIWTIPLIVSLPVFRAYGGSINWIMATIILVVYGKIVSTSYDGRVTDYSDLTMNEMIAVFLYRYCYQHHKMKEEVVEAVNPMTIIMIIMVAKMEEVKPKIQVELNLRTC